MKVLLLLLSVLAVASSAGLFQQVPAEQRQFCQCGRPRVKIVGGVEAYQGEFPWQVGLVRHGSSTPFCGGTLISSDTVLTAAHCLEQYIGDYDADFSVVVGEHDTTHQDGEQYMDVYQFILHPYYQGNGDFDYDFAIIWLYDEVVFSDWVLPACLPSPSINLDRAAAVVSGWGTLWSGGQQSSVLQKVTVTTQSNYECNRWLPGLITDSMLCAAGPGRDACQGDSGGPLVTVEDGTHYSLVGVVSWGIGCAEPNNPGVYSRVTHQLDWILRNMGGEICPKPF